MISSAFVLMALIAVLVFCGLIGVMVWAYSSQSAKRRKSQVGGSTEVRK
jgi:flagellar basal body-associated protein FliL